MEKELGLYVRTDVLSDGLSFFLSFLSVCLSSFAWCVREYACVAAIQRNGDSPPASSR